MAGTLDAVDLGIVDKEYLSSSIAAVGSTGADRGVNRERSDDSHDAKRAGRTPMQEEEAVVNVCVHDDALPLVLRRSNPLNGSHEHSCWKTRQ